MTRAFPPNTRYLCTPYWGKAHEQTAVRGPPQGPSSPHVAPIYLLLTGFCLLHFISFSLVPSFHFCSWSLLTLIAASEVYKWDWLILRETHLSSLFYDHILLQSLNSLLLLTKEALCWIQRLFKKNTSNESSYNMLGGQAFASYWKMGLFCGHTESTGADSAARTGSSRL